jgi:hypothetical protein
MKASSGIFGCGEMKPSALACSKPRIVRGHALDHDGGLASFFGAAEGVPDQPCPHTMRWRSGRTDIGVRLRILGRDPPSTPTQLSIT